MNKMLISLILLLGRICAQPLFHNDTVRCYEEIDGRFEHFYTGFFEYRPDGKILVDSTLFYEDGAPIDFITELFEYDVLGRQIRFINRYGDYNGELLGYSIDSGYFVSDDLYLSVETQFTSPNFLAVIINESSTYFSNGMLDSMIKFNPSTESYYKIEYTYYPNKFPKTINQYYKNDSLDKWHLEENDLIFQDATGKLTYAINTLYSVSSSEAISIHKFEFIYSNDRVIKIDLFEWNEDKWNYVQYCDLFYNRATFVEDFINKKSSKIFKFLGDLMLYTTEEISFPLQWNIYDLQGKQLYSEVTYDKLLNVSKLSSKGLLNANVTDKSGRRFHSKYIQQ